MKSEAFWLYAGFLIGITYCWARNVNTRLDAMEYHGGECPLAHGAGEGGDVGRLSGTDEQASRH